jgi:hypothetical protein
MSKKNSKTNLRYYRQLRLPIVTEGDDGQTKTKVTVSFDRLDHF